MVAIHNGRDTSTDPYVDTLADSYADDPFADVAGPFDDLGPAAPSPANGTRRLTAPPTPRELLMEPRWDVVRGWGVLGLAAITATTILVLYLVVLIAGLSVVARAAWGGT